MRLALGALGLVLACAPRDPAPSGAPSTSSTTGASGASGATGGPSSASVAQDARWLVDVEGEQARLARVAKHLRGLDVAMIEIGHRYGELYHAIRDENFDYATYQLGKIGTALGLGVERRPRRAASARAFEAGAAGMQAALDKRSRAEAERAFAELTVACNACHVAERVAFVHVAPPSARTSVVAPPATASP